MNRFMIPALSATLLVGASAAQAQSGPLSYSPSPYIGGDVMFWELDPDGPADFDGTGLRLRGGVDFNDYFAVEGHLGTGGDDEDFGFDVELDYLVGVYAKGMLPITPQFRLYGLLGATEVEFEGSDDSESDISYGAGGEFDIAPNLAVGADYVRYLDESNFTFDAASVGLTYRF